VIIEWKYANSPTGTLATISRKDGGEKVAIDSVMPEHLPKVKSFRRQIDFRLITQAVAANATFGYKLCALSYAKRVRLPFSSPTDTGTVSVAALCVVSGRLNSICIL